MPLDIRASLLLLHEQPPDRFRGLADTSRHPVSPKTRGNDLLSSYSEMTTFITESPWNRARPRVLVVACSDGRLQENLDDFLQRSLRITHYDRLYAPGGAGALTRSDSDLIRAGFYRRECLDLVRLHGIQSLILLFHGPAIDGPAEAVCADYRRKLPASSLRDIRRQQEVDARELRSAGLGWPMPVETLVFRCEVGADDVVRFAALAAEPPQIA